jgi:hypothetical protein
MKAGRYVFLSFSYAPDRAFRSNWYGAIHLIPTNSTKMSSRWGNDLFFSPSFSSAGSSRVPTLLVPMRILPSRRESACQTPLTFLLRKFPLRHPTFTFFFQSHIQDDTVLLTARFLCNTFAVPSWPRFWWPAARALADVTHVQHS